MSVGVDECEATVAFQQQKSWKNNIDILVNLIGNLSFTLMKNLALKNKLYYCPQDPWNDKCPSLSLSLTAVEGYGQVNICVFAKDEGVCACCETADKQRRRGRSQPVHRIGGIPKRNMADQNK
ncbi:hypothetical protein E2C01_013704 [Portunus trituberculatus]|uniref:Uncharacterized protein n=1 Tax=Portunus trituberculatus TaxID=210409 RepID=A0A5B7DHW0_PORTR|nr:hypothetical protein [Portunus trituberculatus]